MKIKTLFAITFVIGLLGACSPQTSLSARENGDATDPDKGSNSPKPDINEKIRVLEFQSPTTDEADFLNSMELDVTEYDQAYFTFSHAPDENNSFYFTLAQTRLHLKSCTKSEDRKLTVRIVWQEVQNNKRVIIKEFSPNITEFEFKKGRKYYLTYALTNLKELADCKSAKLTFASFLKNYK